MTEHVVYLTFGNTEPWIFKAVGTYNDALNSVETIKRAMREHMPNLFDDLVKSQIIDLDILDNADETIKYIELMGNSSV